MTRKKFDDKPTNIIFTQQKLYSIRPMKSAIMILKKNPTKECNPSNNDLLSSQIYHLLIDYLLVVTNSVEIKHLPCLNQWD